MISDLLHKLKEGLYARFGITNEESLKDLIGSMEKYGDKEYPAGVLNLADLKDDNDISQTSGAGHNPSAESSTDRDFCFVAKDVVPTASSLMENDGRTIFDDAKGLKNFTENQFFLQLGQYSKEKTMNILPLLFPGLFPFGRGGLNEQRRVTLGKDAYVRRLLHLSTKSIAKNKTALASFFVEESKSRTLYCSYYLCLRIDTLSTLE